MAFEIIVDGKPTVTADENVILPEGITKTPEGGYVNAEGIEVDSTGKPIQQDTPPINTPKDDTPKTVTINDGTAEVVYTLDADGNATLNGEVVYTKDQLIEAGFENTPDDKDDDEDIIASVSKISGIELKDNAGNVITFKDGVEGLAEREVAIRDHFLSQGKASAVNEFLASNPDIAAIYNYKSVHGTIENFQDFIDYSKAEITDDTPVDALKGFIREDLKSKGMAKDYIDRFIRMSENDETLKADALASLTQLKAAQTKAVTDAQASRVAAEQAEIAKVQDYYGITVNEKGQVVDLKKEGSLYDQIVVKGKIGDMMVPKTGITFTRDNKEVSMSRLDLFAYFYNPIQTERGMSTQAELDEEKRLSSKEAFIIQGIKNIVGDDVSKLQKALKASLTLSNNKKVLTIIKDSNGGRGGNNLDPAKLNERINSGEAKIVIS